VSGGDAGTLTLRDWIREIYINLLKDGWRLNDVDEMDLGFYLDLINYENEKKYITQSNALDEAGL